MNYQQKLNHYREFYSFHEYQQIMKLIYSIDTYVNNILEMGLGNDMEDALIFAFIEQNETAIKQAIGRLTLFGQNARDDYNNAKDDYNDEPKERFFEDECGCCDRWVGHVCIGPNRFYVEGFGIIDSDGKLVEEDDEVDGDDDEDFACGCCIKGFGIIDSNGRNVDLFNLPYTDDDDLDLRDDFADDEEETFADDDEEGFAEEEGEEEDDEDEERDLYLLRKLVRGIHAILRELEL